MERGQYRESEGRGRSSSSSRGGYGGGGRGRGRYDWHSGGGEQLLAPAPDLGRQIMTGGMGGHSPSNVSAHLKGIDFPAEKDDLCRQAEENGAEPAVMEVLKALDEGGDEDDEDER